MSKSLKLGDHELGGFVDRHVLPDSQHLPPGPLKPESRLRVASDVPSQLRTPVRVIRAGGHMMLGTHVPEAAVYEDGQANGREGDIHPYGTSVVDPDRQVLSEPKPRPVER